MNRLMLWNCFIGILSVPITTSSMALETIVINELQANNQTTFADPQGQYDDWIELANLSDEAIDVGGMFLTDNPDNPALWQIPTDMTSQTIIAAGGFLLIWADGDVNDVGIHANFKLDSGGEIVSLFAADGQTLLDVVDYPTQPADAVYGRELQNPELNGYLAWATPGSANGWGYDGMLPEVTFSYERGFYDMPVQVTLSCAVPDAVIYYTLDGSEPRDMFSLGGTDAPYTEPILIDKTTCLRVRAVRTNWLSAPLQTHTYIFLDDVINSAVMDTGITQDPRYADQMRAALTDLPAVSLVTPAGVVDQAIKDTTYPEVAASVEWFEPDGTPGFQENAGIAHFGGHWPSTNFAKKSFRIYFRSKYGVDKVDYLVFAEYGRGIRPVQVFSQLDLHAGHHDMSQRGFYMSGRLTEDTMLDMGNLNPHGRFVHMYLNGVYWGQYHLHERWNADMLARYLGGEKEDYESIKPHVNEGGWNDFGEPYDGDGSAWDRTMALRGSYAAIKPYLDVYNYIDFMLMYMFGRSEAEFRCVGPIDVGSGFKMWLNDADGFTRSASNRASGAVNNNGPGGIFITLFNEGDPDYLTLLADHIHKHFFNDGAMTRDRMTARLLERCNEIDRAFLAEAARWGYRTPSSWANARDNYINGVLSVRTETAVDEFRTAGFYPDVDAPEFNQHGGSVSSGFELTMTAGAQLVFYTLDGSDPRQAGGVVSPTAKFFQPSAAVTLSTTILGANNGVSVIVPTDDSLGTTWTQLAFDDSGWLSTVSGGGVGYDEDSDYLPHIDLSVDAPMHDINTTVYVRYEFEVNNPAAFTGLTLAMKYDDGFTAYLNGEVIAARNAPGTLTWNSNATGSHDDASAVGFEMVDVTDVGLPLLKHGENVLAIQGLNVNLTSSDMLIVAELKGTKAATSNESDKLIINDNTIIKARALSGSKWSALTEAFFTVDTVPAVAPGDLTITELNYHPIDSNKTEFIELMNVSGHAVNLRGVSFTDGIVFIFPDNRDTLLASADRIILVESEFGFQKAYGVDIPIAGIYSGNLDNGGETLAMTGPEGVRLLQLTYDDRNPWPASADGQGFTLVLIDPYADLDNNNPAQWRTGTIPGGTPGVAEP